MRHNYLISRLWRWCSGCFAPYGAQWFLAGAQRHWHSNKTPDMIAQETRNCHSICFCFTHSRCSISGLKPWVFFLFLYIIYIWCIILKFDFDFDLPSCLRGHLSRKLYTLAYANEGYKGMFIMFGVIMKIFLYIYYIELYE